MLRRAATAGADETDRVGVVDHYQRAIPLGEVADRRKVGDDAVHREHAIGRDQLEARAGAGGFVEPALQIGHVVVAITIPLRLAEANAVDDARMVELVADHRVLLAKQRFEESPVGVEAARVKDAVVGAEEGGECGLELLVHALRATDEAHRGHPKAPLVDTCLGRLDQAPIVGETEIVVGAEVEHRLAVGQTDGRRLRTADNAFGLVEALGANAVEGPAEMGAVGVVHDVAGREAWMRFSHATVLFPHPARKVESDPTFCVESRV